MSSTTDLLELLRVSLAELSPRDDGRPEVLIAAAPDVARHRGVIESVLRHAGGSACFAADFTDGAAGDVDKALAEHLAARVRRGRAQGASDIEVTQVDGNVQARFIEQEGAQSTSEREILGIATMLFAEATVGAEVMLFSYNEDVIDAQMRPHIWRFFSEDLPASRFTPRRVIVLVQMTEIDVPVHCPNGTGLFAYLKDGGLQRRQRWSAAEPLLRAIAHVSQSPDRHIVFFLGAGASVSSGLLLGDGLRDKALEGLVGRDEQVEMIRKFRNFTREHDRELPDEAARSDSEFAATLTLERVMREELRLGEAGRGQPPREAIHAQGNPAEPSLEAAEQAQVEPLLDVGHFRISRRAVRTDFPVEDQGQPLGFPRERQAVCKEVGGAASPGYVKAPDRTIATRYRDAEKVPEALLLHPRAQKALIAYGIGDAQRQSLGDHEPGIPLTLFKGCDLCKRLGKRAAKAGEGNSGSATLAQEDLRDLGAGRGKHAVEDVVDRPSASFFVAGFRLALDVGAARPGPEKDHDRNLPSTFSERRRDAASGRAGVTPAPSCTSGELREDPRSLSRRGIPAADKYRIVWRH